MRKFVSVLCAMAFLGCKGDAGPTGPAGPAGPEATVAWSTVILDVSGDGVILFAGADVRGSVWNCYIGETSSGPWLLIADGDASDQPYCGAGNSGNDLLVGMVDGPPGWVFLATLIS